MPSRSMLNGTNGPIYAVSPSSSFVVNRVLTILSKSASSISLPFSTEYTGKMPLSGTSISASILTVQLKRLPCSSPFGSGSPMRVSKLSVRCSGAPSSCLTSGELSSVDDGPDVSVSSPTCSSSILFFPTTISSCGVSTQAEKSKRIEMSNKSIFERLRIKIPPPFFHMVNGGGFVFHSPYSGYFSSSSPSTDIIT